MAKRNKPKGYWDDPITCEIAVRIFLKGKKEIPTNEEFRIDGGIPQKALTMLGGRKGISEMTGLPVRKNNYPDRTNPENMDRLAKENITPSRAFEIEAEARKVGLSYADIQKQKTLELVGGIQI